MRWLELEGAVNARDVAGLPLEGGGTVAARRLVRTDNLQDLTESDVRLLVEELGVRVVVDLRTGVEVQLEGPTPLHDDERVRIEHRSLYPETGGNTDLDAETIAPWHGIGPHTGDADETPTVQAYLGYLRRRPDSIVEALRSIAAPPQDGAALVHCAAGKDRTGVVVALALAVAGVQREAIIEDYVRTGQRIEGIVARLASTQTYAAEMKLDDPQAHAPRPETMHRVLELLDAEHGGAAGWLREHGFGDDEQAALRARLTA